MALDSIVVTGSRKQRRDLTSTSPLAMIAEEEFLGDLRLYRIPEPVTVAAMSQKQVALLRRGDVSIAIVYRANLYQPGESGATPVVTTRNRESAGLGLALPSGEVAFFQDHGGRRILIGQGRTRDLAVGEDVEIELGESIDVRTSLVMEAEDERSAAHRLTVTNAKDRPVRFEAKLPGTANRISRPSARLSMRDGSALWTVTVPANGSATLSYRIKSRP